MRKTPKWQWKDSDGAQIAAARNFLVAEGRRLTGSIGCIPPNPMEILSAFNREYEARMARRSQRYTGTGFRRASE
jgi:hypothetical protein